MSETTTQVQPKWFMPLAWVAFVWNLLGLMAFVMQLMITPEDLAKLPEAQRVIHENYALWATVAFAVAVVCGTAGSFLLARGKALAAPLLMASVAGIVVQKIHDFVLIDVASAFGPPAIIMSALVFVVAVLLVLMAKKGQANGWLS